MRPEKDRVSHGSAELRLSLGHCGQIEDGDWQTIGQKPRAPELSCDISPVSARPFGSPVRPRLPLG